MITFSPAILIMFTHAIFQAVLLFGFIYKKMKCSINYQHSSKLTRNNREMYSQSFWSIVSSTSVCQEPTVLLCHRIFGLWNSPVSYIQTNIKKYHTNQTFQCGAMLKPFLPQLQTTFIKALNDPNRAVRVKAASALGQLITIHPRVDPLILELHAGINAADDAGIRWVMSVLDETLYFWTVCMWSL